MIDKILGILKGNFVKDAGSVIDNLTVSDDEKSAAKNKLTEILMSAMIQIRQLQASVIKAEIGKGSWLTSNWRPIVMMIFTLLLVSRWLGFTVDVDQELELKLMDIIKIGLGGYVVSRGVEKVADTVTKNIDIPFVKKKDRDLK
jgi:hypothetical protein